MPNESLELSFLSIFSVISFFTFLVIYKLSDKIFGKSLYDDDFDKPQSFHNQNIPRSGGIASIFSFFIFLFLNELLFSIIYFQYLFLGIGLFLIGFFEDIKFRLSPKARLILMTIFLILIIKIFSLEIRGVDLPFLNYLLSFDIILFIFILLCFLFIINGSNLIDGFNGLLAFQLIIINGVLLSINLDNGHQLFSVFLTAQLIVLLIFLLFNFPIAKIFMGDGGAYLFGSFTSLNVITTNNLNPEISSFFFCIILFYLFFEVFFSFIRKTIQKKSPIKPDRFHLHMLSYKFVKLKFSVKDCNYLNSLVVNFTYSLLVLPSFFIKENGLLCKYWFLSLIIIYLWTYFRLNSFLKKKIDI